MIVLTALITALLASNVLADEARALAKGKCVRQAIKTAAKVFTQEKEYTGAPIPPAIQSQARREMDLFQAYSRAGVQKCLSVDDVYHLGWFSFIKAMAPRCPVRKTDALKNFYMEDNLETDLLSGAIAWEKVETDVGKHPFFRGRSEARVRFASDEEPQRRASHMCEDMISGFGPAGDRFGGLVRRQ
jgi:hypothetical protein